MHAGWKRAAGLVLAVLWPAAWAAAAAIDTVAGTGQEKPNGESGQATAVAIGNPFGVEFGPDGGLYVCEVSNHRLWRVDLARGTARVVAGTGVKGYAGDGGPAAAAQLNEPYEVRFDAAGNIYFVEMQNHLVRRIDAATGTIRTVAGTGQSGYGGDGGPAGKAIFSSPHSIAVSPTHLFIADIGNHRIRRMDLAAGTIETIAGTGEKTLPVAGQPARDRPVLGPRALFLKGQTLWVALREGHSIWTLDLDRLHWQHVAGTGKGGYSGDGGPADKATFNGPKGIAVGQDGAVYVVDTENQAIRRIDPQTRIITTVAGSGPAGRGFGGDGAEPTAARLNRPHGVCVSAEHGLFIGDSENHRVRRVR